MVIDRKPKQQITSIPTTKTDINTNFTEPTDPVTLPVTEAPLLIHIDIWHAKFSSNAVLMGYHNFLKIWLK